ncbi:MAG: inosine monophosphate cyclohydrolase [Clostridiales bacterium]|nr:inosine monophosphate cyclohydrolase [Clostridiales bacterium]
MNALSGAYPGRGILAGKTPDGKLFLAYFIMGRSVNSRNRVFAPDGDGLRTQAFDEAKLKDPSLIIYAPVCVLGNRTIVTNGDQTDTIADALQSGGSFESALNTRTFEPDAPNFTPRISGVAIVQNGGLAYKLSILKSADAEGSACERFFYEYEAKAAGVGHFIHTYRGDGTPLPPFEGDPERVTLCGDIDALTDGVWNALHAENKVSLFVRFIELATGAQTTRIVNRNQR